MKISKSSDKRAPLPKTALPRIYFIDREIASGKFPSTAVLAKNYETSISTISRDIAFMKDMLNAPIEYDALRRGYYYLRPNYRIPAGFTTAEDLLALGMAKSILSLYRNTPLYNAAQELLSSITAPLTQDGKSDWFENRIVVPLVASAPIPPDVWNVIIAGLRENLVLAFEYQGAWDEDYKKRRVRPYQLLFVRERQWAEDQKFKETEDAVIIDFTSSQYGKVLEWVLSHGCGARPLEPEKLVKDWRRHIREMTKMVVLNTYIRKINYCLYICVIFYFTIPLSLQTLLYFFKIFQGSLIIFIRHTNVF
jgi:hypothetical protein